jgi:hypothetical protein
VVQVALLLLLLLLLTSGLLRALGPVPLLSCVAFWGACLAPEVPPLEFFAGLPAGGPAGGCPAGGPALGDLFLGGHRWNRRHLSLVAMDKCALSWQTTMSSMCS